MTQEDLIQKLGLPVSRETFLKLQIYEALLLKWQKRLNLVSVSSLDHLWERHFLDSLQLLRIIPRETKTVCDLGSGAGFPGLILAMATNLSVTLIESDRRKCSFLQTVSRETQTAVTVLNQRIETVPAESFDLITARALAPLSQLLAWATPFSHPKTVMLFLKGKNLEKELKEVDFLTDLAFKSYPSLTDCQGHILEVKRKSH